MKKSLQFSLIALILLGLIVPAFAIDTKKINAIKKELTRLNKSYSKAKSAKQKKQIAGKMLQYKAQLKALQTPPAKPAEPVAIPTAPIEQLTTQPTFTSFSATPETRPSPEAVAPTIAAKGFNAVTPPPPPKKRLIMPQFGFVASTIYLGGEYLLFPTPAFDLMMNIGYGYGGSYSLTALGISALFDTGADTFVETTATMANYSKRIDNVPGIQGAVEGNVTGFGLYGGENIGNWRIKVGFSTAMGIGISAGYLF